MLLISGTRRGYVATEQGLLGYGRTMSRGSYVRCPETYVFHGEVHPDEVPEVPKIFPRVRWSSHGDTSQASGRMRVIHRFRLLPGPGITDLDIDGNAEILSIQWQRGGVSMWALVDPTASPYKCKFLTLGTGRNARDLERYGVEKMSYLGTYQTPGDEVYHVFNVTGQEV